jgi:hypothetical protein
MTRKTTMEGPELGILRIRNLKVQTKPKILSEEDI